MASRDRALGLRQPPPADSFSNLTATLPSVCVTPSPDEVISALEYPASAASAASSIDISIADMATATDLLSVPGEPATPSQIKMRSRPRLSIPTLFTSSSWNGGGGTPRSILTSMPTIPSPSSSTTGGRRFSFSYIPMAIRRASWSIGVPSESMVSLSYRSLVNFVVEDNLIGFRGFLDNRNVVIDDRDENGGTALILAASKGKTVFVRELLNYGADANLEDHDNWTPLLCAAKEGHTAICAELLSHGADVNHKDMGGWTALVWACYKGHMDTATVLIDKQADVNVHGQYHVTPLMLASGRGHTAIVRLLLDHGARVNVGDKYGTTALIWACRKGYTEVVDMLLQAGANAEVSGLNCWTPLLVSTKRNAIEIVNKLLERKPNVNALDKDGCTALTIACKEGYSDICSALIKADAYVNVQDRSGDTNLIHAAKAGHKGIVDILLKKYADVDMTGKERKTALYWAVEKNHVHVVKSLLTADPNLEIATKEGDTPLLKSVRNRSLEIVQLLLDKKARVTAADKADDTALHIAMRARSKAIVEVLLRNPKNSQLLYRPNRHGETPYNIDVSEQKTILGQIFGARRLNTNEDNENMLGYDLYSSALADMLSEPSLSMPITVGLYAKWGSGKSFLLSKLREEMKGFARQWIEPQFQFSFILVLVLIHVSALLAAVVGISSASWIAAVSTAAGLFFLLLTFLYVVYWGSTRHSWGWAHNISLLLAKRLDALKLVLQVTFCTPPGPQWGGDCLRIQPIRFYFTDQTKVSRSASGENSVVQMIGSLLDSIESDYGVVATRLYRAFRPKSLKSASPWRFRRFCCVPYVAIFIICVDVLLASLVLLILYLMGYLNSDILAENVLQAVLITMGVALGVVMVANLYTWSRIVKSLVMSQRRKLQKSVAQLHSVRAEGYLQALKREVGILVEMVQCLDAFSGQQTRLVMVVDGLDSCEQDQVLYVLDAVHLLFTEQSTPFITLLAIDPHIIIKAIELNLHRMFNESNIGGHDYLRNLVHLPFYLQNAGLRKVKSAQQAALNAKNSRGVVAATNSNAAVLNWLESDENPSSHNAKMAHHRGSSIKNSGLPGALGARGKLRPSDSMESGLGPPGNRGLAAHDLTKVLLTDDYFSDVNPRSMRRLMNVIYVTGRLLKAFQIEFNWYHLASWVNITEQWPYRTSWIILFCEVNEDKIDDFFTLKAVYERVKPFIPVSKELEPFLEIDRDEKKFEIFLSFHRNTLQVLHLKMFMPFTIHCDPYLRKLIKEERTSFLSMQSGGIPPTINVKRSDNQHDPPHNGSVPIPWNSQPWTTVTLPTPDHSKPMFPKYPAMIPAVPHCDYGVVPTAAAFLPVSQHLWCKSSLPPRLTDKMLSTFTADDVGEMLRHLDGMRPAQAEQYVRTLTDHNISGRVLLHCDLDELKKLSGMTFGDWELFRIAILSLRDRELNPRPAPSPPLHSALQTGVNPSQFLDVDFDCRISRSSSVRSTTFPVSANGGEITETDSAPAAPKFMKRQNTIEKQVTLEDQAICGALQTLNEEAMEDVLDEREANDIAAQAESMGMLGYHSSNMSTCSDPAEMDVLYLQTSVVPDIPFPGLVQATSTLALGSRGLLGHEESVSIGSSLVSLAERGSITPARQRTVTEVVWPENIASALNSGLRSRLSSNTSLFRAGSQKSVVDGGNYALGRRESQRSVSESLSKQQLMPTTSMMESVVGLTAAAVSGGWRSEQGSPRRPASLVLSDSASARDWVMKSAQESPQGSASVLCTTPSALSPPVFNQRFSTTNVELNPEQVKAKLESEKLPSAAVKAVRSPSKKRERRSGVSRTRAQAPLSLMAANKSRHNSSDDTSSDDAHEEAPLMASKDSSGKSSYKSEIRILSGGAPSSTNIVKASAGSGPSSAVPTGSINSLVSANGSSTSSLDSPLDTTDNEVYKTVIPKGDSRRENSLAFILNRPLDLEASKATATPAAQDVRPSTPT